MKHVQPRIGLLPLYLKLYDDLQPERREGFAAFQRRIAEGFEARGVAVVPAPVCRVAPEFGAAVAAFEQEGVDAIVTLHLAYSPSLEALEALRRTALPLILLDTTMDAAFGPGVSPDRIMYNHGVHGVMDLASVLRREGRAFEIVAGHDSDPGLLDRAAGLARAARAARELRGSRALRIGPAFRGMGDFAVEAGVMRERFGIAVDEVGAEALDAAVLGVGDAEIAVELAADQDRYACELAPADHRRAVRVGLGLRRLIEAGGYGAMSVNFEIFKTPDRPADTMPFLEISKSMARGVGYGGEGDVLTAALVGALARAFGAVTFTEIFCADWAGNMLFLSHMGEISPAVIDGRPRVLTRPFLVPGMPPPAIVTGPVRPGAAALVNLAPGPDGTFSLIIAPVEVLPEAGRIDPAMLNGVRAWVRPRRPVAPFLEAYSRAGGTHHSALVLGAEPASLAAFGRFCGLEIVELA